MIRRILIVARREWLEQARQPAMLVAVGTLFLAIGGLVVASAAVLDQVARDPEALALASRWLPASPGDPTAHLRGVTEGIVAVGNWLIFTQLLGVAAVLAGHAILHDRQLHTFPFLLLAPISRAELLLGKVLGALGGPLVLYVVVTAVTGLTVSTFPIAASAADRLPPNPAWWVAFLVGGPAWALFLATVCAAVGSVARDVRTAQQAVWVVMFFATFPCGTFLAGLLPLGAAIQVLVAGAGLAATAGALALGSRIVGRDLTR